MTVDLPPAGSRQVEDQHFTGGLARDAGDRERPLVDDGGAVAGREALAAEVDGAVRDLDPGVASGGELQRRLAAGGEGPRVEADVLMDGERAVPAVGRGAELEPPVALGGRERLLLVARRQAGARGDDPDLQEVHGLGARGVELAVADAG